MYLINKCSKSSRSSGIQEDGECEGVQTKQSLRPTQSLPTVVSVRSSHTCTLQYPQNNRFVIIFLI